MTRNVQTTKARKIADGLDSVCKLVQNEELVWLGASPHLPPVAQQPSPCTNPITLELQTPAGVANRSLRISSSNQGKFLTDTLNQHVSTISDENSGDDKGYEGSVGFYIAEIHRANPVRFRKAENPQLLQIQVDPKVENRVELLPFSPGLIKDLKSWQQNDPDDGLRVESKNDTALKCQEPMMQLVLPSKQTEFAPNHIRTDSRSEDENASHPFLRAGVPIFDSDDPKVDDESEQLIDKFHEEQIDRGTFGEKDAMQELIERTGRVAKRARMTKF
ncbi:hypothetical protein L204_102060 [Cryptococcus depauperatus]|nr:hypothetical protein L204_04545 [Cryptococcus depauperatus CBS 7855]